MTEIDSYSDYLKRVYPDYYHDGILERLCKELCSKLGLTKSHQYSVKKSRDPRIGFIEVAKPFYAPSRKEIG